MKSRTTYPLSTTYHAIKSRCYNPNHEAFKNYGGKGVIMDEYWMQKPFAFYKWALENGWQKGLTIDRINSDYGYCPDNCRIATHKEQALNKKETRFYTVNGETLCLTDLALKYKKPFSTLRMLLKKGLSIEDALFNPLTHGKGNLDTSIVGSEYNGIRIKELFRDRNRTKAICVCHCGNEFTGEQYNIKSGHTKSCGCITTKGISRPVHVIEAIRKAQTGRKHTNETKLKMSIAKRSRNLLP